MMELLELKRKVEVLHQSITDLVREVQLGLNEIGSDDSMEGKAKMITFLLITGVLLAMMSCLTAATQTLNTADVHERTRGNPNVGGLVL